MPTPCAYCGTDSTGMCLTCDKRVCSRHLVMSIRQIDEAQLVGGSWQDGFELVHPTGESVVGIPDGPYRDGYVDGPPRCVACREKDGHEAVRSHADAQTERRQRGADVEATLRQTSDVAEVLRLLLANHDAVSPGASKNAWLRIARSGLVAASHEHVGACTKLDRKGSWPDGPWQVTGRSDLWCFNEDVSWLDADGRAYQVRGPQSNDRGRAKVTIHPARKRPKTVTAGAVLPKGASFVANYQAAGSYVTNGWESEPWKNAFFTEEDLYPDAVVAILRAASPARPAVH